MSKSRFVLKPARVGGSASSDLTRYIAKSKLDKRREGEHARPLFNDEKDDLTFWEARKWLSITGGALPREDVLHYVLSFEVVKDYESLGKTDAERMEKVRAYLRRALEKAARQAGLESWRWAAGIHLNKPHPHVHILINKNAIDARGELRRVEKLLPPLVAHYNNRADETREFDYGVIINSFAADVDARLRDRVHERTLPGRNGRQTETSRERPDRRSDRILLGESMWARHTVEQLERETLALKTHGDKRRFRLFDPTHERVRRVSAHDIRRRAYAEANRLVANVNFSSPEARAHARQQALDDNLARHSQALAEHEEKVQEHLARLEARLNQARENYKMLAPHVENLRARYREKGEPLPLPMLSPEQVGKLQDAAVEARDVARIRTLEKIRLGLAAERGTPTRTQHERGRLAAQLREAGTDLAARRERERQFEQGFHLTRWDIKGTRWSLAGLDARLEKERVQTSFIHVGISAWVPSWKRQSQEETTRLQEIRREVEESIRARQQELLEERERAAATVQALTEIRDGEARIQDGRGSLNPSPIYTRAELDRMESHAYTTRDPHLLMEVNDARLEKLMRLPAEKRPPLHKLAAEAEARAFVAELDFRRAQKSRAEQARWGRYTPVAARLQDGSLITGSVRQTEVLSRADAIIHIVEGSPEKRERARAITRSAAIHAAETQAAYEAAAKYLAAARQIASEYREELEEMGRGVPQPAFNPKDLSRIDLHRAQSENREERRSLQQLLDRSELIPGMEHDRSGRDYPQAGDDHLHASREPKVHAAEPPTHVR
ncbi:MAG: hypothetical protein DMF64_00740 [Acidobacteria bacterium]|nr:MAG: hypothetical protein DMF64_00740 [Acidobacteriota bacterium]